MNRNQRIVVSIVGIIIVTLALIGITYAYFMTKIIGNSTSTSISGTLANLELTYSDGNGVIAPTDPIMPGKTLEKTFSVKNTGSVKVDSYAVVFEDVTNTLTRKNDLVYTLSCSSDDNNPCDGVSKELNFPSGNGIMVLNSIEKGVTHSYTLTVTYKYLDDIDQSDDMGKKFEAKVNIKDGKNYNPYSNNTNSLAYKVINSALFYTTGETAYRETPLTRPGIDSTDVSTSEQFYNGYFNKKNYSSSQDYILYGECTIDNIRGVYNLNYPDIIAISYASQNIEGKCVQNYAIPYVNPTNWSTNLSMIYKITSVEYDTFNYEQYTIKSTDKSAESTLSKMNDDLGVSYYYRGDVEDNYIDFGNMCWRIVRIEGDGSTKIVLEDSTQKCENSTSKNNATISGDLDSFLNTKLLSYKSFLKEDNWEINPSITWLNFKTAYRNNSDILNLIKNRSTNAAYIGMLSLEDVFLSGYTTSYETNTNYLKLDKAWKISGNHNGIQILVSESLMDPYEFSGESSYQDKTIYSRPAVTLKKDVTVTGQGIKSDPYVVQ